jgi:hypothetical protein
MSRITIGVLQPLIVPSVRRSLLIAFSLRAIFILRVRSYTSMLLYHRSVFRDFGQVHAGSALNISWTEKVLC